MRLRREFAIILRILSVMGVWAAVAAASETKGGGNMQLKSTAFQAGGTIPKEYTCDGDDISPQLSWDNAPTTTRAFALIADDPDAPVGTWVHWVIYDLSAATRQLAEGIPTRENLSDGAKQGINDFRKIGYGGPCPPSGSSHRYSFKLYALDAPTNLKPRATKQKLLSAMKGHVLAEADLVGRYSR
jgi:Raf kinase inhibitor-like YbhB/YbcL family protein